ncbi:MAG: Pseudouridine synthase [Candidatus Moranbacteria bacterium GW2011_GWE2_35_2-]|nr:MAG: Pseudouridine synthase [Candidatus Moranbacteria bacterium GW2011_GWE2_35_2-]KKQ06357.1 MAG: Pseudouridine synthase [Candidatus Moranbacteria bacterium GW2011_GWF1_36_4]KKQ22202.1 MAG: Pseudouridine synthase [Candidatus Moranbacteria bacterium GW2011_GWF2_37_11]KKQ28742.1 MAG: Pseudouridine synthase [Candidatus Moranbacteria bacterium GW2011_GWD1_37_17]KKQ30306.1 MAG: Pseudouridine synthase [Candidatus Moranbacteria bacterium GW2011_GWE1_37_24]KKQ47369.1 MAG: Pseudouridine synthase [Ca
MKEEIIIKKEQAGKRIDKMLVDLNVAPSFSRADFARLVSDGKILVNGNKVKPSYVLKDGDKLRINNYELKVNNRKVRANLNIKVDVVYEDENIIAVNKPAGMQVHPDFYEKEKTLVNGLLAKYPEIENVGDGSKGSELRPGIVHRLDKDTSGVMVVARSQKAFDELKNKFKNRQVQKTYQAIVFGKLKEKDFIIRAPIARASSYKKQVIAGKKTKTKIREALTEFRDVRGFVNFTLVEARPKTGRMHQIRVHLFHIGHPIVGDKLYRKKEFLSEKYPQTDRHLLHAEKIEFELFEKKYNFTVNLPDDMKSFINQIDGK